MPDDDGQDGGPSTKMPILESKHKKNLSSIATLSYITPKFRSPLVTLPREDASTTLVTATVH